MDHDPLNDKTIIKANRYIIELAKNKVNIWITITLKKDKETDESFKIKISDFTLIDSYFNSFKGNINLIYNYLIRIFNQNLYSIEKDKYDTEKLVIIIYCLKENKKECIKIKLDNLNILKNYDEKNGNNDNIVEENNSEDNNKVKNFVAAPIINHDSNSINPNDNDIYFYYKNKEKNNNEYNLYIYKNEIKDENYKEIIFKVIEKNNEICEQYFAFLNLVDFFNISEYYFSQFNYSIDEIYNDLLLIFSNHNYRMEKAKNFLKISITYFNSIGKNKNFIAKAYINTFKIDPNLRNMKAIINEYFSQLIKYIKKFGGDINDEKFRKLIKDPEKYINEKIQKNREKKKNEIKNFINNILEEFERKNNIYQNSKMIEANSISKNYNKDISIINNNIIINNKEIVDIYIKESKIIKEKEKKKNDNIKDKNKEEEKKLEINKDKKEINFNINENDFKSDTIKIIIEKADTNELIKKYINNNDINNINVDKNNIINEDNKIISQEKIIDLEEAKEQGLKEEEKIPEEAKEKEKEQIEIKNGKEKIKKKIEPKNRINNHSNISEKQNKENIEKNIIDNLNDNISVFFLNKKRKQNFSINHEEINIYDPIEMFISTVLSRRKRFYNNKTLLTDFQLKFLLTKIEKTVPEFRYLNLQIHTEIIFSYNISQINNSNSDNNKNNETKIIEEFYSKSKNKKNLIFIIKTKNNKTFGGFSETGFEQENNNNCFIFSLDKMEMYDIKEQNEKCVLCYNNKLPEFKNQIIFEENNLKVGYTGNKNSGFLIEEDYELNDGQKMFEIYQIQTISLKGFN